MTAAARLQMRSTASEAGLLGRLRQLAAPPTDLGPRVSLAAVLRRIDETILPRALTLEPEGGTGIRLLVSNRRLMRVESVGETVAGDDALADPDAAAKVFAGRLQPLLASGQKLTLTVARYPADAYFWDFGCSAHRLALELGIQPDAPAVEAVRPASFQELLDSLALAHATLHGDGTARILRLETPRLEPSMRRLIALASRTKMSRSDPGAGKISGVPKTCTVLPISGETGVPGLEALIAADVRSGESGGHPETVLAILPAGERDGLLAAWQRECPGGL